MDNLTRKHIEESLNTKLQHRGESYIGIVPFVDLHKVKTDKTEYMELVFQVALPLLEYENGVYKDKKIGIPYGISVKDVMHIIKTNLPNYMEGLGKFICDMEEAEYVDNKQ